MHNHKKFLRHWQQTTAQCVSNYHGGFSEVSILPGTRASSKDYEKLRRKLFEMKHRMCLLEFGLGSVANLMQNLNSLDGPHCEVSCSSNTAMTNEGDKAIKYKQVLQGIGHVLQDIESCMKTSPSSEKANQIFNGKARIYIDEAKSDERFGLPEQSDVCNIQVLENPVMFPSPSLSSSTFHQNKDQQQRSLSSYQQYHNEYYLASVTTAAVPNMSSSSSSFDALSTLASVATSKHTEELMKSASTQELGFVSSDQQNKGNYPSSVNSTTALSKKTGGHQLVNPFIFSEHEEESINMPLKKRRLTSAINIIRDDGRNGKSTRRMRARRCYQK